MKLQLRIIVVNTHKGVMDWVQAEWPGYLYTKQPRLQHHKISYVWSYNGAKGFDLIRQLWPFIKVKKEQIRGALGKLGGEIRESRGEGRKPMVLQDNRPLPLPGPLPGHKPSRFRYNWGE